MNLVCWNQGFHRGLAVVHDLGITQVEKDAETKHVASVLRDASVAEVEPEQVDVLGRKLVETVRLMSATVARSGDSRAIHRAGMGWDSPGQPVSDGCNRQV
jgi:hypothetical protein